MPRKKTLPPQPYQVIKTEDLEIELLDTDRIHIGKGSHKKNAYEAKKWKLVRMVVDDYLTTVEDPPTADGFKKVTKTSRFNDYLKNASKFANKAIFRGSETSDANDVSALRKRFYHDVLKEFKIFVQAIKNKNSS